MKNSKKGSAVLWIIIIVLVIILGLYIYFQNKTSLSTIISNSQTEPKVVATTTPGIYKNIDYGFQFSYRPNLILKKNKGEWYLALYEEDFFDTINTLKKPVQLPAIKVYVLDKTKIPGASATTTLVEYSTLLHDTYFGPLFAETNSLGTSYVYNKFGTTILFFNKQGFLVDIEPSATAGLNGESSVTAQDDSIMTRNSLQIF